MQELINHMSPVELSIVLVLAGIVIVVVIIALTKSLNRLLSRFSSVQLGSLQLGSSDDQNDKKEPCINSVKFLLVLARQAEYINQRRDIKQSVMPDQMRYAESVSTDIRGLLLKTFSAAMHKECSDGGCDDSVLESSDYHLYRLSLRIMHEDLREWIRECFRENHFHERNEADFERYIKAKVVDGLQVASETLDDLYRGKIMTRRKVSAANALIAHELQEKVEAIFREARRISLTAEAAIQEAETSYNAYAEEQMRGDP